MMARQEWHCWQITSCGNEEHCQAWKQGSENRPCWEVAQELNDYRSALAVCRDCLVFITKENNTVLSEAEVQEIMGRKNECLLTPRCPQCKESS